MFKSIVSGAMVVFALATPVHGQGCPPWMFGCYEQQPQYQTEPRRQHTRRSIVHEHRSEHREPRHSEPITHIITKTRVVHQGTWQDMSQDKAREWIKGQAQEFCGKYPKDEACTRKE